VKIAAHNDSSATAKRIMTLTPWHLVLFNAASLACLKDQLQCAVCAASSDAR
jgi:hypothetical protein